MSGVPWVADLRDPMVDDAFPVEPWVRARIAGSRAVMRKQPRVSSSPRPERSALYHERYGLEAERSA